MQYASVEYRQALAAAAMVASMSRKATYYDNSAMESFWSTMPQAYQTLQETDVRPATGLLSGHGRC